MKRSRLGPARAAGARRRRHRDAVALKAGGGACDLRAPGRRGKRW